MTERISAFKLRHKESGKYHIGGIDLSGYGSLITGKTYDTLAAIKGVVTQNRNYYKRHVSWRSRPEEFEVVEFTCTVSRVIPMEEVSPL